MSWWRLNIKRKSHKSHAFSLFGLRSFFIVVQKKRWKKKKKCSAKLLNRAPTKKRPTSKIFDLYLTAIVALHDASFHHSLKSNTKKMHLYLGQILSLFTYQLYFEVGHVSRNLWRTVELATKYNSFWGLTCLRQPPTLAALFPFYYQGMVFVIRKCIDDFVLHQQQISVQKGWSILFSERIKRDLVVVSWWQKIRFSMVFS